MAIFKFYCKYPIDLPKAFTQDQIPTPIVFSKFNTYAAPKSEKNSAPYGDRFIPSFIHLFQDLLNFRYAK